MDFLWSGALKSVVKNGEHQASAEAFGRKKTANATVSASFCDVSK
jgi:hypothetical protein